MQNTFDHVPSKYQMIISVLFFGESFGAGKFGSLNTEKPTHSQIQAPVCSSRIHRLPSTLIESRGYLLSFYIYILYIYDTLLKHQWVHHSSASHVFWMMIEKKQIPTEALTISMRLFEEVLVMQVGVQMQEEQHICFHWGSPIAHRMLRAIDNMISSVLL